MLKRKFIFAALVLALGTISSDAIAVAGGKSAYQQAYEQFKSDAAEYAQEFRNSYCALGDSVTSVWDAVTAFFEQKAAVASVAVRQGTAKVQSGFTGTHEAVSSACITARDTVSHAYSRSIDWLSAKDVKDKKAVIAAGRISAVAAGAVVVCAVYAVAKKLFGGKGEKAAADRGPGYEPTSEPIVVELSEVQDEAVIYPLLSKELLALIPQARNVNRDCDAYSVAPSVASEHSACSCDCCPGGMQIEGHAQPVPSAPPYYLVEGQ